MSHKRSFLFSYRADIYDGNQIHNLVKRIFSFHAARHIVHLLWGEAREKIHPEPLSLLLSQIEVNSLMHDNQHEDIFVGHPWLRMFQ